VIGGQMFILRMPSMFLMACLEEPIDFIAPSHPRLFSKHEISATHWFEPLSLWGSNQKSIPVFSSFFKLSHRQGPAWPDEGAIFGLDPTIQEICILDPRR
jgi:hypothetical protein